MRKSINNITLKMSAAFVAGFMGVSPAMAQTAGTGSTNFGAIGTNVISSMASLPGLLSGVSYMSGTLIGVLGILKIKDHVENPNNTPLKDGAIRLAAGGGLFALPIVYQAMQSTINGGSQGTSVQASQLSRVSMGLGN